MEVNVRAWLQSHGFGHYADLFAEHEIDGEALLALTESHLKELGLPLGPRVKLHQALQQLAQARREAVSAAHPTDPASFEAAATQASVAPRIPVATGAAAERRQLTVMFVDLVGSTALSARLDPEDLRLVVRGYQGVVAAEVHRVGGHVAQYLGDGVMAYFGYPVAHEGEAERCVRAAQAIVSAVPALRLQGGHRLAVRIGVASGLVVVGDLLGHGETREHAVVGETPNLAARLQAVAEPGQIVISEQTNTLVRHAFETADLGPQVLKGLKGQVSAYRLGLERPISGFEARPGEQLGPMIGRDHELAMLLERWRAAKAGEGQLVVVTGDAGIGKSRIARALQDALQDQPHARLTLQCSPHHTDSALFPFIQYVQRTVGIQPGDALDVQLDRLEAALGGLDESGREDAPVMAAMLGMDGSARYGALDLTPHQLRQKTLEALIRRSRIVAADRPLLLIFEDAHWMDPTTLELVELYVERLPSSRVLMVVTARTGFRHSFGQVCDVSSIVLNRLGRAQIAAVAGRVAGEKALPEALVREITSKTDGVPLFAEELTKTLLASGALRETADAYVVEATPQELAVPASLHDTLMARLDRLQPVKEVAQTAACIGRDFDFTLLAEVLPSGEPQLRRALDLLVQSELIFGRGAPPFERYSFKHALVRDTAYGSLLRATRQKVHARLSAALARRSDTPPELLAHHAVQAGLIDEAFAAYHRAAQQALARPAYKEAIAHLNHACELAERMGDTPPWPQRRLKTLLALGQALIPLRGYGHAQTVAAFLKAQELATAADESQHRFALTYAVWVSRYIRGEQDQALAISRDMVAWARQAGNVGHTVSALRCLAISQMITGNPAQSVAAFDEAAQLSGPAPALSREQRAALAQRFAADPAIATHFHNGFAVWSQGDIEQAGRFATTALQEARGMGHAHTLAHALAHSAILSVFNRDAARAQLLAEETLTCAARHELEMWTGYGSVLKACGLALAGDFNGSAALMTVGIAGIERTQTSAMVSMFHAVQARTLAALGRHDDAAQHADIVQRELRSGSERYFWPECLRLRGDYLLLCPEHPPGAAEAAYQLALQLARDQRARSWELYSALSLSQLWAQQGQDERAVALLEGVLAGWPQPPALSAWREAQTLLDHMRASAQLAPPE